MTQGIVGYYRYTDIVFEWSKVVPEDCVEPLKAILHPACITATGHPLGPEGGGLEIVLGTMRANNEARMLFSTAQIEYIRYWLYEMGLTPQRIPLPRACYIITPDQLRTEIPVVYKTAADLRKALKDLGKANKRVKDVDPDIADRRETFEKVRNLYQHNDKNGSWIAMDVEAWERDHSEITEFGYGLVQWEGGVENVSSGHWIVKGGSRNGTYVHDNRDWYLFGQTEEFPRANLKTRITTLMDELITRGPVYVILHDWRADIAYLRQLGVPVDKFVFVMPNAPPTNGLYCIDTTNLFSALEGQKESKGLARMCRILGIETERLHNAGNDAQYTLKAFMSMASGLQVDAQRDARWPPNPSENFPNTKKTYAREPRPEDESDYDDSMW
ncbi:hypothetical protein FRB94_001031 [Tulasnella sp. JGI-2019a]|nr:hypothetical protein FRB94_001031 [Tulasnella sp. JGI-2019a]